MKNSIRFIQKLILFFSFAIITISFKIADAALIDNECIIWFHNSKINSESKGCEVSCSILPTDMNTFMCPNQCELLCKKNSNSIPSGKLLYYPGLTPDERKLVEKHPKDAITVFIQKTIAESSTNRYFPEQNLNDESDAFRHFIWAGLLTKELGKIKAKEFLDAHENDPDQPKNQQLMDLFNNEKGQLTAEKLIFEKKWSLKNLESEALISLRKDQLKVLKRGLKIPEVKK